MNAIKTSLNSAQIDIQAGAWCLSLAGPNVSQLDVFCSSDNLWVVSPFLCFIIVCLFDFIVSLWWYIAIVKKPPCELNNFLAMYFLPWVVIVNCLICAQDYCAQFNWQTLTSKPRFLLCQYILQPVKFRPKPVFGFPTKWYSKQPDQLHILAGKKGNFACSKLMPRSHTHGLDAGLATDTIRHHSWQSVLVRSFPYCIRNHT